LPTYFRVSAHKQSLLAVIFVFQLIDLFGVEQFELVLKILESRTTLKNDWKVAERSLKLTERQAEVAQYCQQVTVSSKLQSDLRKGVRKEQKRAKKEIDRMLKGFSEKDKIELEMAQQELMKKKSPHFSVVLQERYPFVFDAMVSNGVSILDDTRYCLPAGSTRRLTDTYEEIVVPGSDQSSVELVKNVYIKDMDPLGQVGFEGFDKLNNVQSLVFEQAYKTRENLLICAPTGAGKTNIAMLCILNVVHGHMVNNEIQKDDFKIIYIAPMKALATEMTNGFGIRLEKLGLKVRELTGDTTLSRRQIAETQMLVLTPEKWDAVTRKPDDAITKFVRLLIIDEVHLLQDERGPVIETIVARTLRQVEMTQQGVRIIGLSATLPNYVDVANFLRVNPYKGLFFFDSRFRPVPLTQTLKFANLMDDVCYEKALSFVRQGHQVLVFVHARNATERLALYFKEKAGREGDSNCFLPSDLGSSQYVAAKKMTEKFRNKRLSELFQSGYGAHHAGLIRHDRLLVEKLFAAGHIKVLFCTATLAWGINLPAYAVIIRGTDVFDAQKGVFTDIGVLDVQQIFGRAGRPQYEKKGHGLILTLHSKLNKYVSMLTSQTPIESQFMKSLFNNLNAEIALGTVSNIAEGVEWLKYSYFYIRARLNPLVYGISLEQLERDPDLSQYLEAKIKEAAEMLDFNQMIRFDPATGYLHATDLGRIASHYYIKYETIETFNFGEGRAKLSSMMTDQDIVCLLSLASEFAQIKVRDEELEDLDKLVVDGCPLSLKKDLLATVSGKVNCLIQAFISRCIIRNFALVSELLYIEQNASRLCRAMFEISLRKGWAHASGACLDFAKSLERRIWSFQTPLRFLLFFKFVFFFKQIIKNLYTIIQISVAVTPDFVWDDKLLGGGSQSFWIFVEDLNENLILHYERLTVNKKKVVMGVPQNLIFTVPVHEQQLSHNYQVRVSSDYYVVPDNVVPVSMHNCVLPFANCPHTDLLDLDPLPVKALHNKAFESIYNFPYFNAIQTQVFHCLYHTDQNALIGAPTGSGKTLCAELAIFRLITEQPKKKCVYIAPLKALVRERVIDWNKKFSQLLGMKCVELTGDHTPDLRSLSEAKLVVTTPEKWDGITRSWESRAYVREVALVIIDEIHLLGVERGAVLEAIITRIKLVSAKQKNINPLRVIGLSTALANAGDVAEWLDISEAGLYNFRPSVRPVPVEVHIAGFPGQYYCPRMALMNKPAFKAIKTFSPDKPVLIFVASRRQTRLTAMAFVSQLVAEENPRQWLNADIQELEEIAQTLKDENLKLTLPFGIGMHHAGLQQHERNVVEQLFLERKIQVLITTATLAWGINLPAHLVIIKGTEFYDGKTHKYVDFPVTDVLQMMGRAGRPQYDNSAVAVIYVQDIKKPFYKRFLYEPFPVESSLLPVLPNHINAEIHACTVSTRNQIMEYIANTYLYRRLFANPGYYEVPEVTEEALTSFLVNIVDHCVEELLASKCITYEEVEQILKSTPLGHIASIYYLRHETVRFFSYAVTSNSSVYDMLKILADNPEYSEIPVRHNEDQVNAQLQRYLPIKLPPECEMDSPHTKAHLLFQAHLSRLPVPTDYVTDLRSVLDQCVRIIQAMLDICVIKRWLAAAINVITVLQMIVQARWYTDDPLLVLPHCTETSIDDIMSVYGVNAYCPRFSKEKAPGWFLLVGEKDTGEVLAFLKTPPITGSKVFRLKLEIPKKA
uniref:Activating signal cointegrator 1 complex subunit 3 n=1 Tax=Enterobius vermicularis TaxID=51028 RepID=A0A0N4UZQ9_ENTVE